MLPACVGVLRLQFTRVEQRHRIAQECRRGRGAGVGVGGADHTVDVLGLAVPRLGLRLDGGGASAAREERVGVRVVVAQASSTAPGCSRSGSSGSVTFTSKATLSPQSVNEPFSGVMISTIGAVLPTVIATEASGSRVRRCRSRHPGGVLPVRRVGVADLRRPVGERPGALEVPGEAEREVVGVRMRRRPRSRPRADRVRRDRGVRSARGPFVPTT